MKKMNREQIAKYLQETKWDRSVEGPLDDVAVARREAGKAILRGVIDTRTPLETVRFVVNDLRGLTTDIMERVRDPNATRGHAMSAIKGLRAVEDRLQVLSEYMDKPKDADGNHV